MGGCMCAIRIGWCASRWRRGERSFVAVNPDHDHLGKVGESAGFRIATKTRAQLREFSSKPFVAIRNLISSRRALQLRDSHEPVADDNDSGAIRVAVRVDVLSGDVGEGRSVAKSVSVENQTGFSPVALRTKASATEKQPELQWHVESRKAGDGIQCHRRQIVNSERTVFNDSIDFFEADLRSVVSLECAACDETQIRNCEHNRFKNRPVPGVEWAIYENARSIVRGVRHGWESTPPSTPPV